MKQLTGHVRKLLIMTFKNSEDIDNVIRKAIDDAVVNSVQNAIEDVNRGRYEGRY